MNLGNQTTFLQAPQLTFTPERSLHQSSPAPTQPSPVVQNPSTPTDTTHVLNGVLYTLPVLILVVWTIAVYRLSNPKVRVNQEITSRSSGQVPCRTCRFFTNNPYLKCAVHPSIALTKQAIDCTDYQLNR